MQLISVLRDDRAAPAIVYADRNQIDVLPDAVFAGEAERRDGRREVAGAVAHEQVIVCDGGRPVRREAIFHTDSNHAAPTGVIVAVERNASDRIVAPVPVVYDRCAALHVEQNVVDRVADLTGEKAERVDLRAIGEWRTGEERGDEEARAGTAEISPIPLSFESEHPGAGLPAIANLTAGNAAGCIVATFIGEERAAETSVLIPALAARTPAAVGADVETAPIVDCSDHRRSSFVRTSGQISGRCGSSQCNETDKTQQHLLHCHLQLLSASVGPEAF